MITRDGGATSPAGAISSDGFAGLRASTFMNARLTRKLSKRARLDLDMLNVFGRELRDIDYLATTRMWSQPAAGEANLLGPAEPRGVRLQLHIRF